MFTQVLTEKKDFKALLKKVEKLKQDLETATEEYKEEINKEIKKLKVYQKGKATIVEGNGKAIYFKNTKNPSTTERDVYWYDLKNKKRGDIALEGDRRSSYELKKWFIFNT